MTRNTQRFLNIALFLGGTWVLMPVLLPMILAFVAGCMLYPVQQFLERALPRRASATLASLLPTVLGMVCIVIGALLLTQYQNELWEAAKPLEASLREQLSRFRSMGLPVPKPGDDSSSEKLASAAASAGLGMTSVLSTLLLAQFFLLLGMLELPTWREQLARFAGARRLDAFVVNTAMRMRSYYVTRTISCVLTAIAVGVWHGFMGTPGAVIFAVFTAVANYVPTLGSFASAIPAVAVAATANGITTGLVVAGGLFAIEQILGNVVDPILQGERVGISPSVTLLSVVYWGFAWGIPGAFVGVPITLCILGWMEQNGSLHEYAILFVTGDDNLADVGRQNAVE